jgi:hypothetical protein
MESSELELFTSDELVAELLRRQTFLGVVVQSAAPFKMGWDEEQTFRVHFNSNLTRDEASRLLDVVASHLDREWCD